MIAYTTISLASEAKALLVSIAPLPLREAGTVNNSTLLICKKVVTRWFNITHIGIGKICNVRISFYHG